MTAENQFTREGIADQISQKAANLQDKLRSVGSQMRDVAQEKTSQLRDKATEYYEHGRERAREWEQDLESYVREKPIQSVLIAAGVGLVLGFLWRHR